MIKEVFLNEEGVLPSLVQKGLEQLLSSQSAFGKMIKLTLEIKRPTRSLMQNAYYWGVVIKILSDEIGYDPETMHEYMKDKFSFKKDIDMPDGGTMIKVKSTTDLSTIEFEDYLTRVREWAKDFLECFIPLPNETQFDYTKYEV